MALDSQLCACTLGRVQAAKPHDKGEASPGWLVKIAFKVPSPAPRPGLGLASEGRNGRDPQEERGGAGPGTGRGLPESTGYIMGYAMTK